MSYYLGLHRTEIVSDPLTQMLCKYSEYAINIGGIYTMDETAVGSGECGSAVGTPGAADTVLVVSMV